MQEQFFLRLNCPCRLNDIFGDRQCRHLEKVRDALIECEKDNKKDGNGEKGISLAQIRNKMRNKKKPGTDKRYLKMNDELEKGSYKHICNCGKNILIKQTKKDFILYEKDGEKKHICKSSYQKETRMKIMGEKEKRKKILGSPIQRKNFQEIPGDVTIRGILIQFARYSPPYIVIQNKHGKEFGDLSLQSLDAVEEKKRADSGKKKMSGGGRDRWCIFLTDYLRNESSLTGTSKYTKDVHKAQKKVERRMRQFLESIEDFDKEKDRTSSESKIFKAEVLCRIVDVVTLRGKFLLEIAIMEEKDRNIQLGSKEHTDRIIETVRDLDEKIIKMFSNSILAGEDSKKEREFFEKAIDATYKHNKLMVRSDYYRMTDRIKAAKTKERHGIAMPEKYKKPVVDLIKKK